MVKHEKPKPKALAIPRSRACQRGRLLESPLKMKRRPKKRQSKMTPWGLGVWRDSIFALANLIHYDRYGMEIRSRQLKSVCLAVEYQLAIDIDRVLRILQQITQQMKTKAGK